jgi:hypothetical protein
MPLDHHALLAALVEREESEPGGTLDGSALMQRFGSLCDDPARAWELIARAAGQLRRLGWIDWRYMLWPKDEGREPLTQFIDQQNIQQVQDIVVTEKGLAAHASRKEVQVSTTQINVVNSTVGQLALGDIQNVTLTSVLGAVESAIEAVDAAPEAKAEARGVVRQMRETATSFAGSAVGGVIETALRRSLGLP